MPEAGSVQVDPTLGPVEFGSAATVVTEHPHQTPRVNITVANATADFIAHLHHKGVLVANGLWIWSLTCLPVADIGHSSKWQLARLRSDLLRLRRRVAGCGIDGRWSREGDEWREDGGRRAARPLVYIPAPFYI